ncbi:LysM domain protein, putative [Cordyceps militaris CM01]|uniref:LysM domain protein, putative n=1 Tax=Cordyceps militaris (strain CM01) TaxID=983644 RepID=G3JFQ0_CORMM|nr:LysM domain protein, putative [Cordyceps militaris CM01]EGX92283.1 LysM domain protein, putative [Cordyceps militaris CM01]
MQSMFVALVCSAAGLLGLAAASNEHVFNNQSTATFNCASVANSTSNCTLYTVQSGDSCETVFYKTNATYAQLLRWNPKLSPSCDNLESFSQGICVSNPTDTGFAISTNTVGASSTASTPATIPSPTGDKTNPNCGRFYQLGPDEDCGTIAIKAGITQKDFVFLNPEASNDCKAIKQGYYYCVQPVGRIEDYPGYGQRSLPPFTPIPVKTTIRVNSGSSSSPSAQAAVPTASGTRVDCYRYSWLDPSDDTALSTCDGWAFTWEISLEDFRLWNPSLNLAAQSSTTGGATDPTPSPAVCTVPRGTQYCVELSRPTPTSTSTVGEPTPDPPSPRASGEISGCTSWYLVRKGETCSSVLTMAQLNLAQFYKMNPSIGSDCTSLVIGTNYCISTLPNGNPPDDDDDDTPTTTSAPVATPTPTQPGMIDYCNKFYQVKDGDKFGSLCKANGIGLSDLFKWNPDIGSACKNMKTGNYVCVGASH